VTSRKKNKKKKKKLTKESLAEQILEERGREKQREKYRTHMLIMKKSVIKKKKKVKYLLTHSYGLNFFFLSHQFSFLS
jgi:hypothetical protein